MKKETIRDISFFLGLISIILLIGAAIGALIGGLSYLLIQSFGIVSIGIMAGIGAVLFLIIWKVWIFKT